MRWALAPLFLFVAGCSTLSLAGYAGDTASGSLDELAIYDNALTGAQIAAHVAAAK